MARSSVEAKSKAMALGLCELLWLKIILDDLKIASNGPIKLCCDNKSVISIAYNSMQHDRTKHAEINWHFIKENLEAGLICVPYVFLEKQLANLLTKGLPTKRFEELVCKLGMVDIPFTSLRGSVGSQRKR